MRIVRYTYPTQRHLAPSSVFSRSPWGGLEAEIDQLFRSALSDFAGAESAQQFPLDLYEDKSNSYVRAELPGVDRDNIDVQVADGVLELKATRKTPATEGQAEETFSFSRSVTLPSEVQADQIKAAYENGVLTVTLPKREEAKPRKINVAVN